MNKKELYMLKVDHTLEKKGFSHHSDLSISEVKSKYKIVGVSRAIKGIIKLIDKVASQDTIIMITGESGTGKEMIAYAIHLNSRRADKPFICVNCAAIHETLIESELFGHKRGSFTGAYATKKGKFQLADKGTLFLDEIGDLSANAQAKLLRTIETGEVEILGNEHEENVDVRIISATNKNLEDLVARGIFREDLLHRINVIEINIPPLRQRPDDILPLTNHFLEIYCAHNKIRTKRLTPSAEAVLLAYNWPGNVRELRNIVEKMTVLVDSPVINNHHIAEFLKFPGSVNGLYKAKPFKQAKKSFEKSYITHALWRNNWNVSKTAKVLELPRSSLYEKIKEYNIQRSPENQTIHLY
ncbi:sigma-54-dependent Fis family transcriptional regulator [bacterium]|nr:sigma-54-dependent Fis family transcriptional regulator [bacterium]RQV95502.1 MAG: sigma-54-dependent Fis family transcriptional regulator [bacterium]